MIQLSFASEFCICLYGDMGTTVAPESQWSVFPHKSLYVFPGGGGRVGVGGLLGSIFAGYVPLVS